LGFDKLKSGDLIKKMLFSKNLFYKKENTFICQHLTLKNITILSFFNLLLFLTNLLAYSLFFLQKSYIWNFILYFRILKRVIKIIITVKKRLQIHLIKRVLEKLYLIKFL
jgi:hypothetical protein